MLAFIPVWKSGVDFRGGLLFLAPARLISSLIEEEVHGSASERASRDHRGVQHGVLAETLTIKPTESVHMAALGNQNKAKSTYSPGISQNWSNRQIR
jgi:hypothetical protein